MCQAFLEQLFCTWHTTSMVGQRCSLAVGPSSSSQRMLDTCPMPCPLNVGFSTPSIILLLQTTVNTQGQDLYTPSSSSGPDMGYGLRDPAGKR